ncbi:Carboxylic ester hydrolase [Mycena sanguinolenta]|uniref:Carboxylic ester hydrolase n=1 Tax=Mycena sanguinolenta TaxID=230812 RepID=A0A8H7D436_9AGAR|nr:Carboxylic ester hydrolase [Mycena sanguinolenta]
MRYLALLAAAQAAYAALTHRQTNSVVVGTTSGLLHGTETNGREVPTYAVLPELIPLAVSIFKGVRFGQAPTGSMRWEPPVAFTSTASQDASVLGPACVQQFPFVGAAINEKIFNTPPAPEDEDCLFLNVWAPSNARALPVVIWIYGGALTFGTAWTPEYDGASLAANQNIIVVSFNYRTNVFGFPESPDLPLTGNNLGFLDQELAFQWVQSNIANFGGDPTKVTIMGQSAGARSVAAAYVRHASGTAPFSSAIMLSGAVESVLPTTSFPSFNAMAAAVGCDQSPGAARLACLKQVPASTIRNFTNGPFSLTWTSLVDNVTVFSDPLLRIRNGQTANVPFIIGNTQNDGSLFALNQNNLTTYLNKTFGDLLTAAEVRAFYPSDLSDNEVISELVKDFTFHCPAELFGAPLRLGWEPQMCIVIRAVFADLQLFPNAGAWHSSELFEIFGTYPSDATPSEKALSLTMQAIVANFARNPTVAPAPNWPKYLPGNTTSTLAQLAYDGNVDLTNVVQTIVSDSLDSPCALWNLFLDVRV